MTKKIAVVTALIGAYDSSLLDFEFDNTKYDFICYTNMKRLKSDTWEIRYVDELEVPDNNAKSSYYYKWNPHKYLDHDVYDTMIWVDSSFVAINMEKLDWLVGKFRRDGKSMFIEKHPSRNSLRAELEANVRLNKDDVDVMRNHVDRIFNEGYQDRYTVMVETGLSIRNYKNSDLISFSEAIWDELKPEGNTKRDQLVYDYCMWKTSFKDYSLFTFNEKSQVIRFVDHPNRPAHRNKVLLVGPWFGEERYEEGWVKCVEEYLAKHPVDEVIVGCRPNRESLYASIEPDRFSINDPIGKVVGNTINGDVPRFNVASTSNKEIITIDSSYNGFVNRDRNIHILWSTIRPQVFNEVYSDWISKCKDPSKIIPHVLVDTQEDKDLITAVPQENIIVEKPRFKGVAYPSYVLSTSLKDYDLADEDIVIFASDDFYPMDQWDEALYSEYASFSGCLMVNDRVGKQNKDIVTIPIMSYECLKKLNHVIYHPVYNHCWSDNELYDVVKELDLLRDISSSKPHIFFEHRHFGIGKRKMDSSDEHNNLTYYTGRNLYNIRKTIPIEERLKVEIDDKVLSILVLTISGREHFLENLKSQLEPQLTDNVELLIEFDNGELEVGEKRNKVLDRARGRYICFIDDDDRVSDTYVEDILKVIETTDVDCCSLEGDITIDGGIPQKFIHSLKYKTWYEEGVGADKVYYRNPNHLNVVKREIAKRVRFNDGMSYGEDADYSKRILPYLSVQGEIKNKLYYYDAVSNK